MLRNLRGLLVLLVMIGLSTLSCRKKVPERDPVVPEAPTAGAGDICADRVSLATLPAPEMVDANTLTDTKVISAEEITPDARSSARVTRFVVRKDPKAEAVLWKACIGTKCTTGSMRQPETDTAVNPGRDPNVLSREIGHLPKGKYTVSAQSCVRTGLEMNVQGKKKHRFDACAEYTCGPSSNQVGVTVSGNETKFVRILKEHANQEDKLYEQLCFMKRDFRRFSDGRLPGKIRTALINIDHAGVTYDNAVAGPDLEEVNATVVQVQRGQTRLALAGAEVTANPCAAAGAEPVDPPADTGKPKENETTQTDTTTSDQQAQIAALEKKAAEQQKLIDDAKKKAEEEGSEAAREQAEQEQARREAAYAQTKTELDCYTLMAGGEGFDWDSEKGECRALATAGGEECVPSEGVVCPRTVSMTPKFSPETPETPPAPPEPPPVTSESEVPEWRKGIGYSLLALGPIIAGVSLLGATGVLPQPAFIGKLTARLPSLLKPKAVISPTRIKVAKGVTGALIGATVSILGAYTAGMFLAEDDMSRFQTNLQSWGNLVYYQKKKIENSRKQFAQMLEKGQ